jgi:hypothetical protein
MRDRRAERLDHRPAMNCMHRINENASCKPHGLDDRMRERAFPVCEPDTISLWLVPGIGTKQTGIHVPRPRPCKKVRWAGAFLDAPAEDLCGRPAGLSRRRLRGRRLRSPDRCPQHTDSAGSRTISLTGVIAAVHRQANRVVTTFADQAVIPIENVRLFEEVQARTRELSTKRQPPRCSASSRPHLASWSRFQTTPISMLVVRAGQQACPLRCYTLVIC